MAMAMAASSSLFYPPNSRQLLFAHPGASSTAGFSSDPFQKVFRSPSGFSLAQRAVISSHYPQRPWWKPLLVSVLRRPGSEDRASPEWVPKGRLDDDEEAVPEGTEGGRKRSLLTAEKARILRRKMRATQTWHDAMYHSAIASRLASPDEH